MDDVIIIILLSYNMVNKHTTLIKTFHLTLKSNTHNETDSMLNSSVAKLINKQGTSY